MRSRTILLAASVITVLAVDGRVLAQPARPTAIVGVWTLNTDKTDTAPEPPEGGDPEGRGRGGRGGPGGGSGGGQGGPGGGGFGGGFGGGGGGGGGRGAGGRGNPEAMQRRRDALRDIFEAPARMTVTRTESMVIITTGDGRTTRLATDGSKVKDQSTGIERKTKWDGNRLLSEISGAGREKITETYSLDPESHQLVVLLQMGDGNSRQSSGGPVPGSRRRVYDPQQP